MGFMIVVFKVSMISKSSLTLEMKRNKRILILSSSSDILNIFAKRTSRP